METEDQFLKRYSLDSARSDLSSIGAYEPEDALKRAKVYYEWLKLDKLPFDVDKT